ncbi:MAG TPA: dinitrogenase iron-molybdenum cofactor biosynthesis protein [Firmicutes bacterium]|nr:dinitrogenase iron-molybdenum cofactor biosynthesis protein [Bacillota bacterium]
MRIAVPVEEPNLGTEICASFGRAPYFLIYETETKKSVFVENSALRNPGGAGIKAAQLIVDNQVSALLSPRCGQNAADLLDSAGIKIFKTTSTLPRENIEALADGKLQLLEDIHAGFHGHGGE